MAVSLGGCARVATEPAPGVAETSAPIYLPELPPDIDLVGMEGGAVQTLFGPPALQREEQEVLFWRYSLGRCQLDMFLYPDPKTGREEVAYFEVRPTGFEVAGREEACADVGRRLDSDEGGLPEVRSH